MAVVVDRGGAKTDCGDNAADEKVALAEGEKFLGGTSAHKTIVGVVIDGFCSQSVHHLVEHKG